MFGIRDKRDENQRIAIIDVDRCKPKKCNNECKKSCPPERSKKICIEIEQIATIHDNICIGCGQCVKQCPFGAIMIVRYPRDLERDVVHQYQQNSFRLHRLPVPKLKMATGIIGANGLGKSTALDILSGKYVPNFGKFDEKADYKNISKHYRGTELQNLFDLMDRKNLTVSYKKQDICTVQERLGSKNLTIRDVVTPDAKYIDDLDLLPIIDRRIADLSGGEMQRFLIAYHLNKSANIFIFDEPTSFLDIKQRLRMCRAVRDNINKSNYTIIVEHDLAILDYLCDQVCLLYGHPSAYGVVSGPFSETNGINYYIDGYIPMENIKFKDPVRFVTDIYEEPVDRIVHSYPAFTLVLGDFTLNVAAGTFADSSTIVMLGENGMGKTSMADVFSGKKTPTEPFNIGFTISYKPQILTKNFDGTVREYLDSKIGNQYTDEIFCSDIIKPLKIADLYDKQVLNLSGGELQKVSIVTALGTPAQMYLLDEPSAFLDVESRMEVAKIIKRFVTNNKKIAFVIDHDLMMNMYCADRIILFTGTPGIQSTACSPVDAKVGMNQFLKSLDVTVRRDPTNFRPRINKQGSRKDTEQKANSVYI